MATSSWLIRPLRSAHAAFHRLSLRSRLLLGLLLVSALGLLVADVVVYGQIDSYLTNQVTQELESFQVPTFGLVESGSNISLGGGFRSLGPPGTFIEVADSQGQVTASTSTNPPLVIRLPQRVLAAVNNGSPDPSSTVFRGKANSGATYYADAYATRLRVVGNFGPTVNEEAIAVVAIPDSSLSSTLTRLIWLDVLASLAVLALLGVIGYFVVRVGLRPLTEIERTAQKIAAGDLTQRVELDDERIEVGRLGSSLNEMLGQIEHAFAEQQASENRLRQFLADASHELRTPVTSIRGYAELFRRGAATRPSDLERSMRRIEEESVRMGVLVDDLLLLARLDQGRPLERNRFDLSELVADAAADAQAQAPDREVSVDLDAPVYVFGDDLRLHQVLGNLLQNALRYSPDDAPIEVTLRRDAQQAVLTVTDHGDGIPPEHLAHIFDRFYRADPSRTRGSGGSGLGLTIVNSIVQAHGGEVAVSSEVGLGTTFTVRLTLANEHAETGEGRTDDSTGRSGQDLWRLPQNGTSGADPSVSQEAGKS